VTLTVLDPFGQPAAGVPLVFAQGAFQAGTLVGDGLTDTQGRYTVTLPSGTYLFSALIDFFPPTDIIVKTGAPVERTVRMRVEPVTGAFTVCIDCRDGATPRSAGVTEDLQRDRDAYATALTRTAEPVGGWEQYRVDAPASLRQLDPSITGIVTVAGRVGTDGRLGDLRVTSSAHPSLSDAAMNALRAQRWEPARVRSTPVEVPFVIDLRYVREREQ
jgi:hypothetical protein